MDLSRYKGKYLCNSTDGVLKIHVHDIEPSSTDGYVVLKGFLIYYSDNGVSTDREWECSEESLINDFEEISYFDFQDELNDLKSVADSINSYLLSK